MKSTGNAQIVMGKAGDDMVMAAAQTLEDRKANMANMRKNRAYQELKREMDQRRRAREKVT